MKFSRKLRALRKFRDCHQGERALIIGNGPSVDVSDLEKIENCVTFACNRFHLAYEKTSFRPDYVVSVDPQVVENFGDEILACADTDVFISSSESEAENLNFVLLKAQQSFAFSNDLEAGLSAGGSVLVACFQIAAYMGCREIFVYGVDHSYKFDEVVDEEGTATGDGNHFIANYRNGIPWRAPDLAAIERSIALSDEYLRGVGGSIVNMTRGGALELLPRRSIVDLFSSE